MVFNFCIYAKIFKSFTPIKIRYCILNIFHVCLTVISDFADIYWKEWYTDVNLAKKCYGDISQKLKHQLHNSKLYFG